MSSFTTPTYPSMDSIPSFPQTSFQTQQFPQFPGFQQPQTGYLPPVAPIGYVGNLPPQTQAGFIPFEQSYIENILRLNRGKIATIYMNFENSQWGSKIFKGVIEAAGKDHIIISDPATGMRYLLLTIYLNYITFDEEINYEYPFNNIPISGTQLRKKENKEQNK